MGEASFGSQGHCGHRESCRRLRHFGQAPRPAGSFEVFGCHWVYFNRWPLYAGDFHEPDPGRVPGTQAPRGDRSSI
ncbi:unnamed protein product [Larinioides sclopetarius]|uniref:Uncharacterized protein n=1 Tax=Larinioides sclopetarius TaxID=280406 RepID=A0AAV2A8C7_9ARAC